MHGKGTSGSIMLASSASGQQTDWNWDAVEQGEGSWGRVYYLLGVGMMGREGMKRKAWAEDSPIAVGKPTDLRTRKCWRATLAEHNSFGLLKMFRNSAIFVYSK